MAKKFLKRLRTFVVGVVIAVAAETDVIMGHNECDRIHKAQVTWVQEPEIK